MNFSAESDLKTLLNISKQNLITNDHANKVAEILIRYFNSHKRNQSFKSVEGFISKRFSELLIHFDLNNGTNFASTFFLFCYTLIDEENDGKGVQNDIYTNIAVPFQSWVKNKGKNISNLI